jgi:hypothetical protein
VKKITRYQTGFLWKNSWRLYPTAYSKGFWANVLRKIKVNSIPLPLAVMVQA